MFKLNLLWTKALVRLPESKLESLFRELLIQDMEQKYLHEEERPEYGLQEAKLRKKLLTIMDNYNLLDHIGDARGDPSDLEEVRYVRALNKASDEHINKGLFKDKKLNKLWKQAEAAGFTEEELVALKEEFGHHEDKINQYYSLLQDLKGKPRNAVGDPMNEVSDKYNKLELVKGGDIDEDNLDNRSFICRKHNQTEEGYNRLYQFLAKRLVGKEFVEPKVQSLWKIALESKFTPSELGSLKVELVHYENRLLELRKLKAEYTLHEEKSKDEQKMNIAGDKSDLKALIRNIFKKRLKKVKKMNLNIKTNIKGENIEL